MIGIMGMMVETQNIASLRYRNPLRHCISIRHRVPIHSRNPLRSRIPICHYVPLHLPVFISTNYGCQIWRL